MLEIPWYGDSSWIQIYKAIEGNKSLKEIAVLETLETGVSYNVGSGL